jgi:hypothetical protein
MKGKQPNLKGMSIIYAQPVTKTPVTTNTAGICTIPDISGLFKGQHGFISYTGQSTIEVYVISILAANTILCGLVLTVGQAGFGSNTGGDLSAYSGGSIYFPSQEVNDTSGNFGPTGLTGPTGPTGPTGLSTPIFTLSAPASTSGTNETLLFSGTIPGGTVSIGTTFKLFCHGISSSIGTLIFNVRVGATGTVGSDTVAWTSITSVAQITNQRAGFQALLVVRSINAGTIECEGLGYAHSSLLPSVVGAVSTPSVTTSGTWYIDVSCTCSVGTFTCESGGIWT